MVVAADLCCPRCQVPLQGGEALSCPACRSTFPVVAGIPDLRIDPDPFLSLEEDRKKALKLAELSREQGFDRLVASYYAMTPEVPDALARRYTAHALAGEARGRAALERLTDYYPRVLLGGPRVLDLGCGTGGLLTALASRNSGEAVGVDIALRWLVVARRRLEDDGHPDVRLICAGAEALPFAEKRFDVAVAENLLEHVPDAGRVLAEMLRVGRPEVQIMARVVNRHALAPEPHVGLWGVGLLPRSLMPAYVSWRRGADYHLHPRSVLELRRILEETSAGRLRIRFPTLSRADYGHHSPTKRRLLKWYGALGTRLPWLQPLLVTMGPFLDIVSSDS